ncbi:unnamed protein product [Candida verbasci]|uniref:Thioesterase domain-containing protein n=1 Tax=Candida verbasci TaxID=1227364 RepID=A0A9W4TYI4_9ASCO|nr:unnamed protein product [Candida verbasci]
MSIEDELIKLPAYQEYIKEYEQFTDTNKQTSLIQEQLYPSLTGNTLVGEDKINLRSKTLYFVNDKYFEYEDIIEEVYDDENYSITFFHLGQLLTGHKGIIHGGLLATLLDELTCRLAFINFKNGKGVTANLNINYKKPTFANQFIIIKCQIIKKQGRKCWVKGEILNLNKELLTSCEILVIEPKWVENLIHK